MIDFLFLCERCALRYRAEWLEGGRARRCICGGSLRWARATQLDELMRDDGRPLDDQLADIKALLSAK